MITTSVNDSMLFDCAAYRRVVRMTILKHFPFTVKTVVNVNRPIKLLPRVPFVTQGSGIQCLYGKPIETRAHPAKSIYTLLAHIWKLEILLLVKTENLSPIQHPNIHNNCIICSTFPFKNVWMSIVFECAVGRFTKQKNQNFEKCILCDKY